MDAAVMGDEMLEDDHLPDLTELIWERDRALTSESLQIHEWPSPSGPVGSGLGNLGLALRVAGVEDPVRPLLDLQAADRLPEHTRALLDLAGCSEAELLRMARWLELHGFRAFRVDAARRTWQAIGRGHLGDLVGNQVEHSTEMTPKPMPEMEASSSAVIYAVRGADVLATSAVVHSAGLGGAELSLLEWSSDLFAQGHLIHCYVPAPGGPLVDRLHQAGVSSSLHTTGWWITTVDGQPWTEAAGGIEDLITDLARRNPDLVLTQTAVIPGGALAAAVLGIPHVWWVHERPDPEYGLVAPTDNWTELGDVMSRLSQRMIANSRFVADCYWPGRDDVEIVYPVQLPLEVQEPAAARPAAQVEASEPIPVVGVLGSLTHAKGQHLVVAAVADLRARGVPVRARFAGLGGAESIAALSLQAEQLGVADLVEGIGTWLPLPEALDGLLAVVVPSWAEGFGRVPVEAICHCVPVIYSRSGALLEFLEDGVTGLAFEPGNATDLADAIERVATDGPLRMRLAGCSSVLQSRLEAHDAGTRLPAILTAARSDKWDGEQPWPDHAIGAVALGAATSVVNTRERLTQELGEATELNERLRRALDIAAAHASAQAQLLGATQSRLREREASLDAVLNSRTWRAKARLCRVLQPLGLCRG